MNMYFKYQVTETKMSCYPKQLFDIKLNVRYMYLNSDKLAKEIQTNFLRHAFL